MRKNRHRFLTVCALSTLLLVTNCKTSQAPVVGTALDSLDGFRSENEPRLSTAAYVAIAEGKTSDALAHYERLYKGDKYNPDVALNYAQLLRKSGKAQQALEVLEPFMNSRQRRRLVAMPEAVVINEYAAAHIEIGKFEEAEKLVEKVLGDAKATNYHADAEHLQGLILDAEGQHANAERAYRQALNHWKGDKSAVMNNLGLNLANQGRFDESLNVLREALMISPKKDNIAQNINIVTNLQKAIVPQAPVDIKK